MKLPVLLGFLAAGLFIFGCGSKDAQSNIDPNKNPNYSAEREAEGEKDAKGGFVPDFSLDR
ncbi:MAG: hypothetical protein MH204_00740 [Fimbriimonadaceae bacterium]|nr:hypothetical protein [Fimbriimonadaceae bacterium]